MHSRPAGTVAGQRLAHADGPAVDDVDRRAGGAHRGAAAGGDVSRVEWRCGFAPAIAGFASREFLTRAAGARSRHRRRQPTPANARSRGSYADGAGASSNAGCASRSRGQRRDVLDDRRRRGAGAGRSKWKASRRRPIRSTTTSSKAASSGHLVRFNRVAIEFLRRVRRAGDDGPRLHAADATPAARTHARARQSRAGRRAVRRRQPARRAASAMSAAAAKRTTRDVVLESLVRNRRRGAGFPDAAALDTDRAEPACITRRVRRGVSGDAGGARARRRSGRHLPARFREISAAVDPEPAAARHLDHG